MAYEKFNILNSTAVPLNIDNVDTDQIIPARFLKATERKGFGDNLFRDWRYNSDNTLVDSFPLNNKKYEGKILVAGKNFGCGSSREHAVWAIYDYGLRAVVSSFFADIFKANALNNGLLAVEVSDEFLVYLFKLIEENNKIKIIVNLKKQTINIDGESMSTSFEIDSYKKTCLIKGQDDIAFLLSQKEKIISFEKQNINLK